MKYVIGIDGGGTKTAFAIANTDGQILAETTLKGINYKEYGFEDVAQTLQQGVAFLLEEAQVDKEDLSCMAIGFPCYGEDRNGDAGIRNLCETEFSGIRVVPVNDAVVGYYGALSGRSGINVVAGTGSIAYGRDDLGTYARSGGWSEHFSDEGSCYWLGHQSMSLFCREADGRVERGALYDRFREVFRLEEDFDFIEIMEKEYLPYRSKVASLQRYLLEAARDGDAAAQELYKQAAREIGELAYGVYKQLQVEREMEVTVTGGLLHAMDFVRPTLVACLSQRGMVLKEAERSPLEGAVILALRERRS